MGIFQKIRDGLKKTRDNLMRGLRRMLGSFTKIDEELFEQLEETMIMGDMGAETAVEICDRLRDMVKERGITDPNDIMGLIQEITAGMLGEDEGLDLSTKPSVILVIGVNGAGKTTTIGKLCHQFRNDGKRVLVAAADTFRAAAIDQLQVWTDRSETELVRHAEGSDPAAVVFDAITAAKARGCDVVICDTAGRLHNKKNLMQELAKINRIIDREAEGCAKECLLVLDATTGQNAVNQARLFQEVAPITGIVLTKLDGTAKGGIVISIKNELNIPVKLIGVGEGIDDLQPFEAKSFIDALFDREIDASAEDSDDNAEEVSENNTDEEAENISDDYDDVAADADDQTAEPAAETESPTEEFADDTPDFISEDENDSLTINIPEQNDIQTAEMIIPDDTDALTEAADGLTAGIAESVSDAAEEIAEEITEEVTEVTEDTAEETAEKTGENMQESDEAAAESAAEEEEPKKKKGFFSFFKRKK
ncbi:MAG: signal recognition particle-docking protein FtsY [Oscillospiraceae bacterium]|nr:signal recognition particle-docking protein FtsY [Oscillospiraceae bacterium]